MQLIIANKLYSSWSMRPWLVMRAIGLDFEETVTPLRQPDTAERIRVFSPSGRVPVLIDGEVTVWESLAIICYLADKFPDQQIWPNGAVARAHAMSIAMEMHGGFQALRQACPMNLGKRFAAPTMGDDLKANVARIEQIWRETRARFGGDGPYLFGTRFSAADAMFAPVATRIDSYSIPVAADTRAYIDTIYANPHFAQWRTAAFKEPWHIPAFEEGLEVIEDLKGAGGT
ncbi:MAG TPA: glutathione S-transferase family protein [Hyphomicrobiaceae bacterium]|nr:glutathione S-transferase family protein [Hyphomicrobiaceae bacterium]